MAGGLIGRVLRVDLTNRKVSKEPLNEELLGNNQARTNQSSPLSYQAGSN